MQGLLPQCFPLEDPYIKITLVTTLCLISRTRVKDDWRVNGGRMDDDWRLKNECMRSGCGGCLSTNGGGGGIPLSFSHCPFI